MVRDVRDFDPVYGALYISAMAAIAGDTAGFTERTARIHWGLLICVCGLVTRPRCLSSNSWIRRPERKTTPVPDSDRRIERRASVHLGEACRRARSRPTVSPVKTVEGSLAGSPPRRSSDAHSGRSRRSLPARRSDVVRRDLRGIRRRTRHVRNQAGSGRQGFGASIAGHGGDPRSRRLSVFAAPVFFH